MARRDTVKVPGGPLESEFVKPRKIFNLNKVLGEKTSHSQLDQTKVHSSELEEVNIYKQAPEKEMRGI